jgi:hypothetical protein
MDIKEHPLYPDIRSLVLKTIGLVDILKNALRQDSDISIAFVWGTCSLYPQSAKTCGNAGYKINR